MFFPVLFLMLMAEALLMIIALDYELRVALPPALAYILKKLDSDSIRYPKFLAGITSHHGSPRAPVSKGHTSTCAIHKNGVMGCATFFEHDDYEYKLLCHGELYFRPKGTHIFRLGPILPKKPGSLFTVKLDSAASKVITFCFVPGSRALGEVNGYAEFRPVQTCIASSQEAHGLEYTQGQGCIFDWIYGACSSSQYPWDYNRLYDVGWMHSNATTEELFVSGEEVLAEDCPLFAEHPQSSLTQSLGGLDLSSFEQFHLPGDLGGEIRVGLAHVELNNPVFQQANNAQSISTSSALPSLPVPLTPAHQSGASTLAGSPVTSRSVLRRTCAICSRVLRRPSALAIHMNAHFGYRPHQCPDCHYSSTNVTNLQRHQQNRHASGGN
ncbi:unnamed protein product [Rhizoctonia solani]|uniref:C2H2-type domain-containing protein n=1 Tax=Rhizoctonia solani TaxID=456999 RepID=A0A8H2WL36_9AGAM|nr:unnamed protein product [Rhizoctonia solani]